MERTFYLDNGIAIPQIGFGTYKVTDGKAVVMDALLQGYRHFDTAAKYENEDILGRVFQEADVPRHELFLTSKVWKDDLGYDATMRSFESSLKKLQTNYLDLFLIHWPLPNPQYDDWKTIDLETWRALEQLYDMGAVNAIGVCNFLPHHMMNLLANCNTKPMINQLEYHPGYTQQTAVSYSQANGIQVEAWSPLGRARLLEDPLLLKMAEKYGRSVAQICIRFALQNNILPLPKSSAPERMRQNLDVYDFELSLEDMYRLLTMEQTGWSGLHPDHF